MAFLVVIFIAIVGLYLYYGPFPIPYDICDNLGDGYTYHEEHSSITGRTSIGPKILQYSYNDKYIIATEDYTGESYMPKIEGIEQVPFDSIDTDNDDIVYWILNKKTNEKIVCGTENEFVKKCDSIGIPDNMVSKIIN